MAAGGDLACRMGLALDRRMEEGGWYPPPILAGFGAAAGAAMLLGLGPAQIRDCLSLDLCQVTMSGEIKYSTGTVIRAVREAFPAQAAVQSALLAEKVFQTQGDGRDFPDPIGCPFRVRRVYEQETAIKCPCWWKYGLKGGCKDDFMA
jgi:2-methylcitrate dehydratase PrpD